MRRLKLTRTVSIFMVVLMVFGSIFTGYPAAHANETEITDGLIAWYNFDDIDGEVIKDASGHNNHASITGENYSFEDWDNQKAVSLGGGNSNTGAHMKLPDGILEGITNVTITTWVNLRGSNNYTRIFDFGNNTTSYMYLTPTGANEGAKGLAFGITTSGWGNEQTAEKGTNLQRNKWIHVAVVISGHTVTIYEDGIKVAENRELTLNPASLGSTKGNYIGRSQFANDPTIDALFSDFRIYNRALKTSEISELIGMTDQEAVEADKAAINLGNLRTVENDLVFPTEGQYGSTITWESSHPDVISNEGKVTRPEPDEGNAKVTLTATITKGSATATAVFEATVLANCQTKKKLTWIKTL